ncbi:AraC family transcriptional regulator [Paenibacillus filicis]|uniref:AraC family transcriptional regulator n=1 Tax=Paenibacillus filicis TaxID=669464 RepID=A0ABU9DLI9_9BACL
MNQMLEPKPKFEEKSYIFHYRRETLEGGFEQIHAHQGIEFLYVHEGSGHLMFDQKLHPVGPGTLFMCQPYQLHKFKLDITPSCPYIRSIFIFDPSLFERYMATFPALHMFFNKLWKAELQQQVLQLEPIQQTLFAELLFDLHRNLNTCPELQQTEEVVLFLFSLLREFRKLTAGEPSSHSSSDSMRTNSRHVEQMMAWINEHFSEEFSLDRLAESLHLSPYYASHLFSRETGCTLSQYVMAHRIRESRLLLSTTDLTIAQIGQQIGFKSSAYFVKSFKSKMGITPQAYRKQVNTLYVD